MSLGALRLTDPSETIEIIDQIFDWIQMLVPHECSSK